VRPKFRFSYWLTSQQMKSSSGGLPLENAPRKETGIGCLFSPKKTTDTGFFLELGPGGNKTRLIDKDSLEARLGRSPDLADAMIQSFAF
jgi:hypothetical protein